MTEEQFSKYTFRHSEIIIYHQKHPEIDVDCLLLGINFDNNMLRIVPVNTILYEDDCFWAPIEYCDKERAKMKVISHDGVSCAHKNKLKK